MTIERFFMTKRPAETASAGQVLAWAQRNYQSIQRAVQGLIQKSSTVIAITDYGNVGDGRDATTALTLAYAAAKAARAGAIFIPSGVYPLTHGFTFGTSVLLQGEGNPVGGTGSAGGNCSVFVKTFVGDLFTFDGSDMQSGTGYEGGGGGFDSIRIAQGVATGVGVSGSAIVLKCSATGRVTWWKMNNCLIEENGLRPWTWALDINGATVGAYSQVFDTYITNTSTHTTGTGAIRLNDGGGLNMTTVNCFDTAGNIVVGDALQTNQVHLLGVSGATLAIDRVSDFAVDGGTWTTITNTANSTAAVLRPDKLVNAWVDLSGGATGMDYFGGGAWHRTP